MNKTFAAALCAATMCLGAGQASANSVTYYLNQSNVLPDGTNYVQVDITDSGDDILFDVQVLVDEFEGEGTQFGMQDFFFNAAEDLDLLDPGVIFDVTNPDAWEVDYAPGGGAGEFGKFVFQSKDCNGQGCSQGTTLQLQFKISNVDSDTIFDWAVANTAGFRFATHIIDFDDPDSTATSGMFASVVPIPAAAWLFGSALLGFMTMANRRRV
jgi:hypothetical protein